MSHISGCSTVALLNTLISTTSSHAPTEREHNVSVYLLPAITASIKSLQLGGNFWGTTCHALCGDCASASCYFLFYSPTDCVPLHSRCRPYLPPRSKIVCVRSNFIVTQTHVVQKKKKGLLGIPMGVLEHLSRNNMVSQEEGSLSFFFLPIQDACKTASANDTLGANGVTISFP